MTTALCDTLDSATVTQLAHPALKRYPALKDGSLKLLCRSENATFRVLAQGKPYVALMDEALERIGAETAAFGKSPARYGLIHADLRLTNLLLHQGETRVIDFDD